MRNLTGLLIAMLLPAFAFAQEAKPMAEAKPAQEAPTQEAKPIQLADYVSFCLALSTAAADANAKATALGLRNGFGGAADAHVVIGKSAVDVYRAVEGNQIRTVIAMTTTFADGKDFSCDVNFTAAEMARADLEAMERALDLDGQILTFGPAIMGRWKLPHRQPAVLVRATLGKNVVTMNVQEFEAAAGAGAEGH